MLHGGFAVSSAKLFGGFAGSRRLQEISDKPLAVLQVLQKQDTARSDFGRTILQTK